jgi:prolyl-tRNA synthetase
MKISKALIETLREDPRDAESKSHRLLLRGGFIKQHAAGIHSYLPLSWRIMLKISSIIREELDRIGAQEILMPAMSPREIWDESGRWAAFGDDMFRLKDRKNRDYCLCPTHEEIITEIARLKIRSYRDLPQIWYQIQTKFRDELRPRSGVIRSRQFIMKDSYSLDTDEEGLGKSFDLHKEAYTRIFNRCGLDFIVIDASGGLMGTGESKEFTALVDSGEDRIVLCSNCGYSATIEMARGAGTFRSFADSVMEKIATPERRTIEEVTRFLDVTADNLVKSMFFTGAGREPLLVLVRGDYEVNETHLRKEIGADYQPASAEDIIKYFKTEPGFIGPAGVEGVAVIADDLLKGVKGMVIGANQNGYHIRGFNIERDASIRQYMNIRTARPDDRCVNCGRALEFHDNALELGQIFKLGTKYSQSMGAYFLDESGAKKPIVMGSYGIGLERIMACACEQKGDERGAVWPVSIAPYDLYVVVLNPADRGIRTAADEITAALTEAGFSMIVDDRDDSAGVKFNDADLIGIPLRLTIGPKGVTGDHYDISVRETNEKTECSRGSIVAKCREMQTYLYERLHDKH